MVPKIPTRTDIKDRVHSTCGITVARITCPQSGFTRKAVITYANRTIVSHLKTRTMDRYEVKNKVAIIKPANNGVQK